MKYLEFTSFDCIFMVLTAEVHVLQGGKSVEGALLTGGSHLFSL